MKKFLQPTTYNLKATQGFTLIETLVALAIFSTSIVALISVTGSGVANTNYAKNKFIASYLAQEGVELVRNIRDTNSLLLGPWADFLGGSDGTKGVGKCISLIGCDIDPKTLTVSPCPNQNGCPLFYDYTDTGDGFYTYPTGATSSPFTRKITVTDVAQPSSEEVNITSTVSWNQGGATHRTSYSENLLNWIQ
ncbi:MAG TPA: prepilin-type N-terminal cleavage/methylation domain-containing protein [Candidatus Paceibacterota bacterium]